ncbi:MAG: CtsR family transcriptional regulator [Firmicutes bacterium]|nr:CtsR family transcriptional regulator [Bacillota bacterium]
MGISDRIESFITELMKAEDEDAWVELRRNELASIFNCVPSQINYVIATRFSPDNGYIVESKRGGGGYLRIRRIDTGGENPIYTAMRLISDRIDFPTAKNHIKALLSANAIDERTADVLAAAVSDNALAIAQPDKDRLRASILKNALAALI